MSLSVLVVPLAEAQWRSLGTVEPDTPQDAEWGFMFGDADPDGANPVYFNVVAVHAGTATNPNAATFGRSRVLPEHAYSFEALYGVWVDCNRDGYIGMADTALFEYRSELLLDPSACPAGSAHNRQDWVSEMRFIGHHQGSPTNGGGRTGRDARVISDPTSAIWGDRGLAGVPLEYCMKPTDAVLAAEDCSLAELVDSAVPEPVRLVLDAAADDAGKKRDDIMQERPTPPPLAPEQDGPVWDCTGSTPEEGGVRAFERLVLYRVVTSAGGECAGSWEPPGDAPPEPAVRAKRRADITFAFYEEQRGGSSKGGEPMDRGVYPVVRANPVRYGGSHWFSQQVFVGTSAFSAIRSDLMPAKVQYFTFYANLSLDVADVNALSLPAGSAYIPYGAHWCGAITQGVLGGFDCDADAWYRERDGSRALGNEFMPLPGTPVRLLDVDCYDPRAGGALGPDGASLDPFDACPRV